MKITDKTRLDWVVQHQAHVVKDGRWDVYYSPGCIQQNKNLRKAIDAAIRAEKRGGYK